MQTPVEVLPIENLTVLKVIQVHGDEWNRFTGYLYYQRRFTREYQSRTPDYLDELIINAIKGIYPDSRLCINKDIIFKGELEDILKGYKGGNSINLTIRFTPQISYDKVWELVGQKFHEYYPRFTFNLLLNPSSDKIKYINDFIIAYIPFEQIEDFDQRIQTLIL